MGFNGLLKLTLENVTPNSSKKTSFKLLANATLGKFSQRKQFSETIYIKTQKQLEENFLNGNLIDIQPVTDNICEIQIEQEENPNVPRRNGNCVIGAFVTAFARIKLHQEMLSLVKNGFDLYYIDTDGIIFAGPSTSNVPLNVSPCLGDFKHELGKNSLIDSFYCLGRKNYSLSYTKEGKNCSAIKCSGLALSSSFASEKVTVEEYKELLQGWEQDKEMAIQVPQLRKYVVHDDNAVQHKIRTIKLSNCINTQRKLPRSIGNETLPFGYEDNT